MTGMALQALAPYCSGDAAVQSAVDKAVSWLSGRQTADGKIGTSSESAAQTIVALTALGIDPRGGSALHPKRVQSA
ncbi:MAG: hypothetical protein LBK56_08665 [Gracilibacteraceae bacterium]|jgi:hypothetical protein|nr:hypothetical protein [Gracilibacteraceae bacterium]